MKKKIEYKWVIMALGMLTIFTTLGFCSSNRSLFLKAISSALDIPRSQYSLSDSCRYITTAVLNIFFGRLIVKWGERKMLALGFLSLIAFCLLFAFGKNVYVLYAGGACLGMGLAWSTTSVVGYFVGKWFRENKGTIMGIILASNGVGAAISAQLVTPIIHDESMNGFGYRKAYLIIAAILLVCGIIVVSFFRDAPEDLPAGPAAAKKKSKGINWVGITQKEAVRKPYFYVAAVCIFFTGAALQSISGVATAHLEDVGLDTSFIATAFSLYALCLGASKILAGVSYDHLGLKTTVLIADSAAVLAIFALSMVNQTSYALAFFYEIVISLAMPLETVLLPLITSDLFGQKEYPKLLGTVVAINTAGYALGAPVTNLMYDLTGSYRGVLKAVSLMMLVILIVLQVILRVADRERETILAAEK